LLSDAKLHGSKALANHQLMGELPAGSHAPLFYKDGGIVHQETEVGEDLLAAGVEFVHERHVPAIGKLPLLLRPVDVRTVMIQVAEAFLEAGLGVAAEEGIEEVGP
jgi:hypothetical protein